MHTKQIVNRALTLTVIFAILVSFTASSAVAGASLVKMSSYIVQAANADLATQLVEEYGGVVTSRLEIIKGVGATLSEQAMMALRFDKRITALTLNGSVNASDNGGGNSANDQAQNYTVPVTDYPKVVGADVVWSQGVIGSGVTVAILDTGLGDIPALTKGAKKTANRVLGWQDFVESNKKLTDPNGHGSHIAGIIGNSQKNDLGNWNGVAPDVSFVGVRVLNAEGFGTYEKVIQGLQWVIQNQARYNIRIVNLSLVAPVASPYWADPLDQAVTQAWASGLVVVAAAGNGGPGAMSITVPGNNPYVITVGAFTDNYTPDNWDDDYIPSFSSAGPTLDGFVKPDVIAPGAHMVSVIPQASALATQYPSNQIVSSYFKLAGTSQATATVSGIAALILAKNPSLTPNDVKQRMVGTALPWVDVSTTNALYSMWQQGAGRVNAPDAVFADIAGSANNGMDIQADLAGTTHYEGYSYYDDVSGTYQLYAPYAGWIGGYGTWDGNYYAAVGGKGTWIGGQGVWASGKGAWAGSKGAWAGSMLFAAGKGAWAGSKGAWAGSKGAWAGGYTTWAGGKGAWAGGKGAWAGGKGAWAGSVFFDPAFIDTFISGKAPNTTVSRAMISFFLQDP